MRTCYAAPLGGCSGGLSREHYISRSVLAAIGPSVQIEGAIGLADNSYPINALTARVLCRTHNTQLAPLDAEAARAFGKLREFQTDLDRGASLVSSKAASVDGQILELWLLKLALGIVAARKIGSRSLNRTILSVRHGYEHRLLDVLFGNASWPSGWGMYIEVVEGLIFAAPTTADGSTAEFGVEPMTNPSDHSLWGLRTWFRSFRLLLCFGRPDYLSENMYRPGGLRLRRAGHLHSTTLHLRWSKDVYNHRVIDFTRLGEQG